MSSPKVHTASFRDPCGFMFTRDGQLYRQINRCYQANYDHLLSSGLYTSLVDRNLLIGHEEVSSDLHQSEDAYKIIKPRRLDFISYPYEWSFGQYQAAALATLAIQKQAFKFGMTLKDASAFNIQFIDNQAVLIDTLSFEIYQPGQIWYGYRQFCQHFLAPLALMHYRDVRLNQLLRIMIDGVDLDLASKLLPWSTRLRFSLLSHIHLHAAGQRRYANKAIDVKTRKMSKLGFQGLIDSLESAVKRLSWKPTGTEWGDYYTDTNYSDQAMTAKEKQVADFLGEVQPAKVWDLGANDGRFSRIAARQGAHTVSFDIDPAAVEKNYRQCINNRDTNLLPLVLDLTNPSGAIGWNHAERQSLIERGPADCVMALALIHHLAISNNLPLDRIAAFLAGLCHSLIIEWVPKNDSQVQRLLATREDIFPQYTQPAFEAAFLKHFHVIRSDTIEATERALYLMENRTID